MMASHLSIYTLATGAVTEVLSTDRMIEAPNWTPDGGSLIVNGDGLLWSVDLAAPGLTQIPTGKLSKLNNDHGISPDGTRLAISDGTADGKSAIYTLPFGGGEPTRITPEVPSYWHGWSPDGTTLAFVGQRNGSVYDVYTMPSGGGAERKLTEGFAHTDGPDYTPDGKWIWFNGQRDSGMQLWRIPTAGGAPEQMTDDERWNWFPHPSPDGKHVLYVAFEPGTTGHPRDREVELRLLPAGGGTPRVLHPMFGGQGTINVPCWAPDAARFAFVHYDRP
jgi:Tol biopolymer transport system component